VVALFQELLLAGHDGVLVGLVLGHHGLEALLAQQDGRNLVVAAGRRVGRLVRRLVGGLVGRLGLRQAVADAVEQDGAGGGRPRQQALPGPVRGSVHAVPPGETQGTGTADDIPPVINNDYCYGKEEGPASAPLAPRAQTPVWARASAKLPF